MVSQERLFPFSQVLVEIKLAFLQAHYTHISNSSQTPFSFVAVSGNLALFLV